MKKYFLLVAISAILFAGSCTRERFSDRNVPSKEKSGFVIDDGTPMRVLFSSQFAVAGSPTVATKGIGAVDDWQGNAQKLYVYGFSYKRFEQGVKSYEWLDLSDSLMSNVAAFAPEPSSDDLGIRLDGSQRSQIMIYNHAADGGKDAHEPYYYREDNENGEPIAYSFFAYYVDDAVAHPEPVVTPGSLDAEGNVTSHGTVVLNNLQLDGTQDIMLATTDKEVDALARSRYIDSEHYNTSELTDDDLGEYVEPSRIYSAHAARRGVNPDLVFEHQLSRFTFFVKKGGTVPSASITIDGIDLFDYSEGTLTIVGGKSGTDKEIRGIAPVIPDGKTLEDSWKNQMKLTPTADPVLDKMVKHLRKKADGSVFTSACNFHPSKEYEKIGAPSDECQSILAFAGRESYDMIIRIFQEGATADPYHPYKLHLPIVIGEDANGVPLKAEPGKNYNVYLTVYGLEEVRVSVTITKWEDDEIYIDPDEDDVDERDAASIMFGTDRGNVDGEFVSHIQGQPTTKLFEATPEEIAAYPNPGSTPLGELTIRTCDKFDLLDTLKFVKGDPTNADPDLQVDHYEPVLAFVRSNSNGVFHFECADNPYLTVTDAGLIEPKPEGLVTPEGSPVRIIVRQNSSNDFLAAVPRVIDVTIVKDNRVPVRINWKDKNGEDGQDPKVTILNDEGGSMTLDMLATFTIWYNKDKSTPGTTYYTEYTPDGWDKVWKVTGASPYFDIDNKADFEGTEGTDFVKFDLSFESLDYTGEHRSAEFVRVDPKTGVITALKPTVDGQPAKVAIHFNNLKNDDTYTPVSDTIDVVVIKRALVVTNVPESATVAYNESFTIRPNVSNGGGAISFESADDSKVSVGLSSGIVTGLVVSATPVNVTVTVAGNQFYEGTTKTVAVTVIKATPKLRPDSKTMKVGDAAWTATYTVKDKAGNDISAEVGAITFSSANDSVFTVDSDGKVTPVGPGRANLTISVAGNDNYESVEETAEIVVRP